MRKSFKIKNLIRNNRYAFLSRGEEKNLLANEMSLQILGGGQMCMSNMLYRIPSPLGEKVAEGRMRGHKGTVASLQRLYVIPQRQTKSALPYWMLVAIQHTPVPSSRNENVCK